MDTYTHKTMASIAILGKNEIIRVYAKRSEAKILRKKFFLTVLNCHSGASIL